MTGLNTVFDDKRIMVCVVWGWLIIVLGVFTEMGLLRSDFVRFGPSPTTMYVGIVLDTWSKWSAVAIFTAISSFMNDLAGESLEPFFLMVIRDHKTRYIPYSKTTSVVLNQAWTLYCSIMSVFGLYTYFAQVDLLVIKMVVGLIVNMYSSMRYLRNKSHEPVRYLRYFTQDDMKDTENDEEIHDEQSPTNPKLNSTSSSLRGSGRSQQTDEYNSSLAMSDTMADVLNKHTRGYDHLPAGRPLEQV
jgi:hypothetical protein